MTERVFASACLITVSSGTISRPLTLIDLRNTQYAKYPNTLIYAPFFLYPRSIVPVFIHDNVRVYLCEYPTTDSYHG